MAVVAGLAGVARPSRSGRPRGRHVAQRVSPFALDPRAGSPGGALASPADGPAAAPTLPSLTALRAVAAVGVLLYTLDLVGLLTLPGPEVLGYGAAGFFFVLSGFVLTWRLPDRTDLRAFYGRRAGRIYPGYLPAALAVLALLAAGAGAVLTPTGQVPPAVVVVAGLGLLQAWWPTPEVALGLGAVPWSLSVLVAFAAATPVLVPWLRRLDPRWRVVVPVAWLSVVLALAVVVPAASGALLHHPLARAGEFLLGVSTAVALGTGWGPRWRLAHALVLAAAVTAVLVVTGAPAVLAGPLLALPFAAVLAAAARSDLAHRSRLLRSPRLVTAGALAFAVILVHPAVLAAVAAVGLPAAVAVGVGLTASVGVAILLHHGMQQAAARLRPAPVVAAPAVAEPAVAEPAVAEPAVAEPDAAEPDVAEPDVAEPDVAESAPPREDHVPPRGGAAAAIHRLLSIRPTRAAVVALGSDRGGGAVTTDLDPRSAAPVPPSSSPSA